MLWEARSAMLKGATRGREERGEGRWGVGGGYKWKKCCGRDEGKSGQSVIYVCGCGCGCRSKLSSNRNLVFKKFSVQKKM